MANLDAPFGFVPYRHLTGGIIRPSDRYWIDDDYGTAIFEGDMVSVDGAGNLIIASASTLMIGAFVGVWYQEDDGTPRFRNRWPASQSILTGSKARALVYDDPMITYKVQATGDIAEEDLGLLADIDVTGTGSTTTGRSAQGIGAHASTEANFRILQILTGARRDGSGNQAKLVAGQDAVCEVQIVEHLFTSAQTTEV